MYTLVASLIFCLLSTVAWALPAQVILIRHGEKPATGNELSKRGFERADALISFFTEAPFDVTLQPWAAIYAQPASKNHLSRRPVQTVTPLAEKLGLQIKDGYTRERYAEMCDEIKSEPSYEGKLVLICWSHDDLTNIAEQFGVKGLNNWPGSQFDRMGVITFSEKGEAIFQDLPQKLLFGDSNK